MIPNHNEAVNAALGALAEADLQGKPGQGKYLGETVDQRARFILQGLSNEGQRESHLAMLEDRAESVSLPVGIVVRLMLDAMEVPWLEREYESLRGFEKDVLNAMASARKIMKDRRLRHDKRMRKAIFELGLIGKKGGAGRERVDHRRMAHHYYALRRGAPDTLWEGEILAPHSHNDAVKVIEVRYGLDWDSLAHACNVKKIPLRTDAEVFPIK